MKQSIFFIFRHSTLMKPIVINWFFLKIRSSPRISIHPGRDSMKLGFGATRIPQKLPVSESERKVFQRRLTVRGPQIEFGWRMRIGMELSCGKLTIYLEKHITTQARQLEKFLQVDNELCWSHDMIQTYIECENVCKAYTNVWMNTEMSSNYIFQEVAQAITRRRR